MFNEFSNLKLFPSSKLGTLSIQHIPTYSPKKSKLAGNGF